MGPGPRRSIRLRRLPDDPGTTKEYLRLLVAVLVLFALQASMGETDLAIVLQLFVAGSALILALRIADAHARVQRYIGLLCFVALGAAILQAWEGDNVSVSGSLLLINGLLVATGPVVLFQAVRRHPDVSVRKRRLAGRLSAVTASGKPGRRSALVVIGRRARSSAVRTSSAATPER